MATYRVKKISTPKSSKNGKLVKASINDQLHAHKNETSSGLQIFDTLNIRRECTSPLWIIRLTLRTQGSRLPPAYFAPSNFGKDAFY